MFQITIGIFTEATDKMKQIVVKANKRCEWIANILIIYVTTGFVISINLTAILNVIFCLIRYGSVETRNLFYPAKAEYVSSMLLWIQCLFFLPILEAQYI